MNIYKSAEDYLETILILQNKTGAVRSIDIVRELDFSKPSVSRAVKLLREGGYLSVDENGYITLTDLGREIAEQTYERHLVITEILTSIGVSKETAESDACSIEHVISRETFDKIKEYYNKHR
ncbi:MAG: metal-dependent transcriptional regulator [Acutalibacteraceae bacterium]